MLIKTIKFIHSFIVDIVSKLSTLQNHRRVPKSRYKQKIKTAGKCYDTKSTQ